MILLDTHVMVWLALSPEKLSSRAKNAIRAERAVAGGLAICGISLLELTTLVVKGRIHLDLPLETFFQDIESRFTILPINGRVCLRTRTLPAGYPKDPADRVIGATAISESVALVTADREIRDASSFPTIW